MDWRASGRCVSASQAQARTILITSLMWLLLQVTYSSFSKGHYSCSLVTTATWNIISRAGGKECLVAIDRFLWHRGNRNSDIIANVMRNYSVCTSILWRLACSSVLLVVWKVLIMWSMRKVIWLVLLTSRWRPRKPV